jgi:hypothetical protein
LLRNHSGILKGFAVFAEPGQQYAIYFQNETVPDVELNMPDASYVVEWLNPSTGQIVKKEDIIVERGTFKPNFPTFWQDIALKIVFKK